MNTYYLTISVDKDCRCSLAWWLWIRVFYEITVKLFPKAMFLSQDWIGRMPFQCGSSVCWQASEHFHPCALASSHRSASWHSNLFLDRVSNPRKNKREQPKWKPSFLYTILEVTFHIVYHILIFLKFFIYCERKRDCVCERAEGEGQADSVLNLEPNAGLDPKTLRSWPQQKSRVGHSINWATQVPLPHSFY